LRERDTKSQQHKKSRADTHRESATQKASDMGFILDKTDLYPGFVFKIK
jgi:hypothetical protein